MSHKMPKGLIPSSYLIPNEHRRYDLPHIGGKLPQYVKYIIGLTADNLVGEFHCGRVGANTFHSRSLNRVPFCRNGRGPGSTREKSPSGEPDPIGAGGGG